MRALVLLSVVALVAGCLAAKPEPMGDPLAGNVAPGVEPTRLAEATGKAARGFVESYVMTHPFRLRETATHQLARDDLVKTLEGFGLEVQRDGYETGENILGIHRGVEKPDEWIVFSAHYDTAETTVFGAWDDGAGVAAVLEMARAYSQGTWSRTLVFAFFDGEEQGLEGSRAFVQEFIATDGVALVANLNYDPPGLNWPCKNPDGTLLPLSVVHSARTDGGDGLLQGAVERARLALGVPDEAWQFYTGNVNVLSVGGAGLQGTSDHASFGRAGVAFLSIGGDLPTVLGPVEAAIYPYHTPIDALAAMDARCGGIGELEKGFQAALDVTGMVLKEVDAAPSALFLES